VSASDAEDREAIAALEEGERKLGAGDPEGAALELERAAELEVPEELVARLARALVRSHALLDRHRDALTWLERALARPHEEAVHASLLSSRIQALRQLDTRAVLDLADEALAAVDAVGDQDAYASVLANAAFAAYRRGDIRSADRFAHLAAQRAFTSDRAAIDGLRARMFAATASESLEASLEFSQNIRDRLLAAGEFSAAANESNNVAEALLRLGRPGPARVEADRARGLGYLAGHRPVEEFSRALVGQAMAEDGDLDGGIELLRQVKVDRNEIFAADVATRLSFYLVERSRDGDAACAESICQAAVSRSANAGVSHCLTSLISTQARAQHLLANDDGAKATLARARSAAYAADAASEQHLALAMAEVLPSGDPARSVSLNAARARLLRSAGRRADPRSYCTGVRLHRRLLELSGGVPEDLPQSL
jgi:hypothetical protein